MSKIQLEIFLIRSFPRKREPRLFSLMGFQFHILASQRKWRRSWKIEPIERFNPPGGTSPRTFRRTEQKSLGPRFRGDERNRGYFP